MLKKKERLSRAAFNHFFSIGKRRHSFNVQLLYTPHTSFHGSVVVGKKVFKKAVDRNALRRSLYGVLYRHHKAADCTGVYILVVKPSAKNTTSKKLLTEVAELLSK